MGKKKKRIAELEALAGRYEELQEKHADAKLKLEEWEAKYNELTTLLAPYQYDDCSWVDALKALVKEYKYQLGQRDDLNHMLKREDGRYRAFKNDLDALVAPIRKDDEDLFVAIRRAVAATVAMKTSKVDISGYEALRAEHEQLLKKYIAVNNAMGVLKVL